MAEAAPTDAHNGHPHTHSRSSAAGGSNLRAEDRDDDADALDDESLQQTRDKRAAVASAAPVASSSAAASSPSSSSSSSALPAGSPAFASATSLLPAASAHKATSAITTAEEAQSHMVRSRLSACGLSAELIDSMRPTVSRDQLHALWTHYPADKSQCLDPADACMVATWLYSRVPVLFRSMVARANPRRSKAEVSAMVREHLPHLLPGSSDEVACYLVSSLQLTADGRVSKDEMMRCWNRHARLIFPSHAQQISSVRGAVYCTIL